MIVYAKTEQGPVYFQVEYAATTEDHPQAEKFGKEYFVKALMSLPDGVDMDVFKKGVSIENQDLPDGFEKITLEEFESLGGTVPEIPIFLEESFADVSKRIKANNAKKRKAKAS